ncbi:MAG TPA: hypothetical protein VFN88_05760 [Caulobacteraceae bacterium]|nr:hypothetical protein [Caulobacteraceae bacterium]
MSTPANRALESLRGVALSMVAIGMIAVFLIVILGLNRWEFGRFD